MIAVGHLGMLLLGMFGFAMLASAMDRHEREIHGRSLGRATQRCLRVGGSLCLLLSLLGLIDEMGAGVGTVVWLMVLSCSALAVVLLTTYRPHWLGGRRQP